MASRSRGQKVKGDVAGSGFLNQIPTNSIVAPSLQPLYYQILSDLHYPELSGDRQILAWQIAWLTCRIYSAMNMTEVVNDADRQLKQRETKQLPDLQKQLITFINAFNGKRKDEKATEEAADLQTELNRIMDERRDSQAD